MSELARSFAPIAPRSARRLVLGSMPGLASLAARQYYAHPRNAFWPIMAALLGFDAQADYALRVAALRASGVALWDVLHSCKRAGSLDQAIEAAELTANDLAGFLRRHPDIVAVYFNGAAAETLFRRHVLPDVQGLAILYRRLPSTSPAHAALTFEAKLLAWRSALCLAPDPGRVCDERAAGTQPAQRDGLLRPHVQPEPAGHGGGALRQRQPDHQDSKYSATRSVVHVATPAPKKSLSSVQTGQSRAIAQASTGQSSASRAAMRRNALARTPS
jgi:TDG/mug DNA glycosylase family protein